jgi:peroxiredoxin
MSTAVGNTAPDVNLIDHSGHEVQLSSLWQKQPLVLIFVRHLG